MRRQVLSAAISVASWLSRARVQYQCGGLHWEAPGVGTGAGDCTGMASRATEGTGLFGIVLERWIVRTLAFPASRGSYLHPVLRREVTSPLTAPERRFTPCVEQCVLPCGVPPPGAQARGNQSSDGIGGDFGGPRWKWLAGAAPSNCCLGFLCHR